MKTKNKLYSVAFASVALIFFLVLLSSTAAAASSPIITETRITTNPSNSLNPVIYGNTIVWQDDRNGNWDIYIFDLTTKQQLHTTNTSNQYNPAIYDNKVVWEDERNGGHDIYLQDLSTKKQTRITTSGKAYNPRINGNRIVWQDKRNGQDNWDIYMFDISSGKETQITTNGSNQTKPDIFGDRIVWYDDRNIVGYSYGHPLIYMYNISTSVETPINYGEVFYFMGSGPRIYGDIIVWMAEGVGTNYNIYMFNLSTSTLNMIEYPLSAGCDSQPAIYGNKIVWTRGDVEPDSNDIYMYDLSTLTGTQITTNEYSQSEPAIYGDRIVWKDERNRNQNDEINYDIYMATLSSNLPVAAFSASPTAGYLPLKVAFTDRSTGSPTSWKWNFGDGTYSTAKNPVHTYSKTGKYTVSLTIRNAAGSNTITKSGYIVVNALKAPVAAFTASPTAGYIPLKVAFTDKSTGSPTSWKWSFGDGTYSTAKNSVHTYSKAGKYTVSLTVRNAAGSNTVTKSRFIVANVLKAPVAAFKASPTSGKTPLKVQFTDKSTNNPTSWKWSFGDGTYSTQKNPSHTYSKAGKYTISLTVKNAKGSNIKTISGYITVKSK